jgi:molybdopterin-guanine dinucleotide biosynthesis protein A
MGTAKHLLAFLNDEPMYIHLLTRIMDLGPIVQGLFLSMHDPGIQFKMDGIIVKDKSVGLIYDTPYGPSAAQAVDIGPAAGLLAAHQHDPRCTWLVLACDYPLISRTELQLLLDNYDGRLTCFKNAEGWIEPLIGLWSPEALGRLRTNVANGKTGPKTVVQDLNSNLIFPKDERSLFNANTMQEWDDALKLAREMDIFL